MAFISDAETSNFFTSWRLNRRSPRDLLGVAGQALRLVSAPAETNSTSFVGERAAMA